MCDLAELPLLCVTDRAECARPFLQQMRRVAAARPAGVLLREKDLTRVEYRVLAGQVAAICAAAGVPLAVHTHVQVARSLGCRHVHLTLPALEALPEDERVALAREFELSTSCHSVADAVRARQLGCRRIIAGHVFETDCKPGLKPRGLAFLHDVCAAAGVPVWAIGGITPKSLPQLLEAGAAGACLRGYFMRL